MLHDEYILGRLRGIDQTTKGELKKFFNQPVRSRTKIEWGDMYKKVVKMDSRPQDKGTTTYNWVIGQRMKYTQGKLSNEQISLLEAIPWWSWFATWETKYQKLKCKGIANIKSNDSVYAWMHRQRRKYCNDELGKTQKNKLDRIKGWKEFCRARKLDRKSPQEWVKVAETLANDNGGLVPNHKWLTKNGYQGLQAMIRKHPELFSHLPQKKMHKSAEEWLDVAQKLCEEHGGKLPTHQWLKDNGYIGLGLMIRKKPDMFSEFNQEKMFKSIENHIEDAERLAKNNGGKLPTTGWLCNNGYEALYRVLRLYPNNFRHIPRTDVLGDIKNKHLTEAQMLIRQHGHLPNSSWLCANGYGGLYNYMKNHPKFKKLVGKSFPAA